MEVKVDNAPVVLVEKTVTVYIDTSVHPLAGEETTDQIAKKNNETRPFFSDAIPLMEEYIKDNFIAIMLGEGGYIEGGLVDIVRDRIDNGGYEPLSPQTISKRRSRGVYSNHPLKDTLHTYKDSIMCSIEDD